VESDGAVVGTTLGVGVGTVSRVGGMDGVALGTRDGTTERNDAGSGAVVFAIEAALISMGDAVGMRLLFVLVEAVFFVVVLLLFVSPNDDDDDAALRLFRLRCSILCWCNSCDAIIPMIKSTNVVHSKHRTMKIMGRFFVCLDVPVVISSSIDVMLGGTASSREVVPAIPVDDG
jgi:hypothetical protein